MSQCKFASLTCCRSFTVEQCAQKSTFVSSETRAEFYANGQEGKAICCLLLQAILLGDAVQYVIYLCCLTLLNCQFCFKIMLSPA